MNSDKTCSTCDRPFADPSDIKEPDDAFRHDRCYTVLLVGPRQAMRAAGDCLANKVDWRKRALKAEATHDASAGVLLERAADLLRQGICASPDAGRDERWLKNRAAWLADARALAPAVPGGAK